MEVTYQFGKFIVSVYNILTTNHYCFKVWVEGLESSTITYENGKKYGSLNMACNKEFEDLAKFPPMTEKRSNAVSAHYKRMDKICNYLLERAKRATQSLPEKIELA